MHRRTGMSLDRLDRMFYKVQSVRRFALILLCSLLCCAAAALPARGEPQTGGPDVLSGAFGESIDSLDASTRGVCFECAGLALDQLLTDYFELTRDLPRDRYLQILQTTFILPGTQPPDATDIERAIWSETYADAAGVVSFVALTDSLNIEDIPYAEVSDSFDYVVQKDGTVKRISLRADRSRFFSDMIVPGVRVINMGSHYNSVYTVPGP